MGMIVGCRVGSLLVLAAVAVGLSHVSLSAAPAAAAQAPPQPGAHAPLHVVELNFQPARRAPGAISPSRRELVAVPESAKAKAAAARAPGAGRRASEGPDTENVGVHGGVALGYFWAFVEIGTPPQRFSVILDTGSSLCAVPCANCAVCGEHMDPKFDPDASSTARYVDCHSSECPTHICKESHCKYSQSYAEGSSLSGVYLVDKFWIGLDGEDHAVDFRFGCHDSETNMFKTQLADGIMGLAARDNTIVSVLQEAHQLPSFVFTLCLGNSGGQLVVGGVNTTLHTGGMTWIDLQGSSTFYTVTFQGIEINGESIGQTSMGRTIVDSGTTFTYIPRSAYLLFKHALEAACHDDSCGPRESVYDSEPDCFDLGASEPDFSRLFSMTLVFSGLRLEVTPDHYLSRDGDGSLWCLGILENDSLSSVIGANVMRGYDVAFDRDNGRVGFAPARCTEYDEPCATCNPGVHPGGEDDDDGDADDDTVIVVGVLVAVAAGIGVFAFAVAQAQSRFKSRTTAFHPLPQSEAELASVEAPAPPTAVVAGAADSGSEAGAGSDVEVPLSSARHVQPGETQGETHEVAHEGAERAATST